MAKWGFATETLTLSICLSLIIETEGQSGCSQGWFQLSDTCIYVENTLFRWEAAQARCNDVKADLLVSKGANEDRVLRDHLGKHYYWTGLKEDEECRPVWEEKFQARQSTYEPMDPASSCNPPRCFLLDQVKEAWSPDLCISGRRSICQRAQGTHTDNAGNPGNAGDDESDDTAKIVVPVVVVIVIVIIIIITAVFIYRLYQRRKNLNKTNDQKDLDVYAVISDEDDTRCMNVDVSAAPLLTLTAEGASDTTPHDVYSNVNKRSLTHPQEDGRTVTPEGLVYLTVAQTERPLQTPATEATPASGAKEPEPTQYVTVDLVKTSQRLACEDDQENFFDE